ncbi:hypothetical protein N9809_06785, partial [Amylibacter sp.]|nr:hypothetical protein [Amylibacter sp.]
LGDNRSPVRIGDQLKIKMLMTGWVCRGAPPSASPDCKLAHNCVNNRVVSGRYRLLRDAWAEALISEIL